MAKIFLRLVGGLGNQLYQFAAAYRLLKSDCAFERLVIDASGMANYNENWGYLLDRVLSQQKLEAVADFEPSLMLKTRAARLFRWPPNVTACLGMINDQNYDYFSNRFPGRSVYLDGYFEKIAAKKEHLSLLSDLLREDLRIDVSDNDIVINVRGGDYLRLGYVSFGDRSFYQNSYLSLASGIANPRVHVVTDDPPFAKEMLQGVCPIDHIHDPDPFENFRLIYSAKHKVLSKSTFSKWAGFLSSPFSRSVYQDEF